MQLIRNHYLDNFKDHLTRWEKDNVTAINCALWNLGITRLSDSSGKTFRIIRSIERMIGNLKYPDGPDLGYESAKASTYRYIFASPYDKRFAALTPEELCFRLKETGVPEAELQFQRYEDILSGQPTATLAMVSVNNGKAYVLRPQQPFVLTSAPDGTFPLEIDQHPQKNTPLQERRYSMPPPKKTSPPAKTAVIASVKATKTKKKKPGRKPKIHQ